MNTPAAASAGLATMRLRQLPPLLDPLRHAVRWQPSLGAAALAALLVGWKADDLDRAGTALMVLRGVAALLALGAGFLLDDAAASTLAASPTALLYRRSHRMALGLTCVGLPWAFALLAVRSRGTDLPLMGLTIELAAMVLLTLATCAVITHRADVPEPGVLVAPLIAGFLLAAFRMPERWALMVAPGPSWEAAHGRWAVLATAAILVLVQYSRDPARSRVPSAAS